MADQSLSVTAPLPDRATGASGADTDERFIEMWLHNRPAATVRAYAGEIGRFRSRLVKPLRAVTLGDVQNYVDGLGTRPASQARSLAALKSLLSFGVRLGYLPLNAAAPVRLPKRKDDLAERIVDEADVHRLIALEPDARNRLILLLLYAGGLRISELRGLKRRDVKRRPDGGQITVFGKGGKTRVILLSKATWKQLASLIVDDDPDAPVFVSRKGGHLDASAVHRIVKAAAKRVGLDPAFSAHWLRHAHASHALDRGATIALVRDTLGHASISTTNRYAHARPGDSSARYLAV